MLRLAAATAIVAALAGCTGAGYAGYTTTGTVYAEKTYDDPYYDTQPTMVPVHGGVWVVEGRSHPVFYSSGAYWRYDNGYWYRSSYVDDGYVRVRAGVVPRPVVRIDRPTRYVRYRAPVRARVRVVPPAHVRGRVDVRRPHDDRDRVRVRPRDRDRRYDGRYDRRYDDRGRRDRRR
jgi:hypothetical protein